RGRDVRRTVHARDRSVAARSGDRGRARVRARGGGRAALRTRGGTGGVGRGARACGARRRARGRARHGVRMTLDLHVRVVGSGPPLVLLHGFTGSAAAWGDLSHRLAERFRVLAFDLPGHGASPAPEDPARARLPQVADALMATLDRHGVGAACWLGYSLGGRLALRAALDHPSRVRALVLEGASPGIADPDERRARAAADATLADA